MRILLDTNILIYREAGWKIPENISKLSELLTRNNFKLFIHPIILRDIESYENVEKKEIFLSKIKAYPKIDWTTDPDTDSNFRKIIVKTDKKNDKIDDWLLYAVFKDAVGFLITEDNGIHKKASKLQISQMVFKVDEAIDYFSNLFKEVDICAAPDAIKEMPLHNIDLSDKFFDELKEDYKDFENWFKKKSQEGKKAWVFTKNDKIGAFLLLKEEEEAIIGSPNLEKKKRLKRSTLKASYTGFKIGELFLKISLEYAIKKNIDEIYLTHYTKNNDDLILLIEDFGFHCISKTPNGEDIYIKNLKPNDEINDPIIISKYFYPSFYDGCNVRKFIIPIIPIYHERLFQDCPDKEIKLFESFLSESNTIKKAYISNSNIKKIKAGDVLFFYKSKEKQGITSVGVAEKVYYKANSSDEIMQIVGKRTVYRRDEIDDLAQENTVIILFRWHFYLEKIKYQRLLELDVLKGAPQSILEITNENYSKIKREGKIDEGFTVN